MFLLDADAIIRSQRIYYPREMFPVVWDWLAFQGNLGLIKVPFAQYDEVTIGKGPEVDWLKDSDIKDALLLAEEPDPDLINDTLETGYGTGFNDVQLGQIGRDPILIAHARTVVDRCVVTLENSAPSKRRQNRKVPDVCADFGVRSLTTFELLAELGFTMSWTP